MRITAIKSTLVLLLFFASFSINAGVIVLDGTYQGDDVYFQNPYNSSDNSFCVTEAYINDAPVENINSSAFEVPLSNFKIGDYVRIKLVHRDYCKPRVLNPEVLMSKSTYELVSMKVDESSLKWTTNNESNHEPFVIEHFRNNKWVPIGKVIGKGPDGYNNYNFEVNHHSGVNKYRIKQRDLGNKYKYAQPVEYISDKSPITYYPKRVDKELYLSESTTYEIYDSFGGIVLKGEDQTINVSDFEPGIYYLNIDNRTEKFLKK